MAPAAAPAPAQKKNFLDAWLDKKSELEKKAKEEAKEVVATQAAAAAPAPAPAPKESEYLEAPLKKKDAPAPAKQEIDDKLMEELENDGDGSGWVATAVKNVEEAPAAAAPVADGSLPAGKRSITFSTIVDKKKTLFIFRLQK